MSEDEVLKHYEKMAEIYGNDLPDPDVYPRTFAFYCRMYKRFHMEITDVE